MSVMRIVSMTVLLSALFALLLLRTIPGVSINLWVFDWQAFSAIATMLAAGAALYVGLLPGVSARQSRRAQAHAVAMVLERQFEFALVSFCVAEQVVDVEFLPDGQFDYAIMRLLMTDTPMLERIADRLDIFDPETSLTLAAAYADIDRVHRTVSPLGNPLLIQSGSVSPDAKPDLLPVIRPARESCDLALKRLEFLLGRNRDPKFGDAVALGVAAARKA